MLIELIILRTKEEVLKSIATSVAVSGTLETIATRKPKEVFKSITSSAAGAGAGEAYRHFIKNAPGPAVGVSVATAMMCKYALNKIEEKLGEEE